MRRWRCLASTAVVVSGAAMLIPLSPEEVPAATPQSPRTTKKASPPTKKTTTQTVVPPGGPAPKQPAPPTPPPPSPPPPTPPPGPVGPPVGVPLVGLGVAELARFNVGKGTFLQPENPIRGLGPVFTENSCVRCHRDAAPGGAGDRLVTRFGRIVGGQFDPMIEFGGPQVQDHGIGRFNGVNFVGEVVPPQATIVARRRTSALFGLGLVDAVPDGVFLTLAQHEAAVSPATAGRVSAVVDPVSGQQRVGKFGWKAQQPTLLAFAGDAFVNELGITTPMFPTENCPQGDCSLLAANPAASQPNEPTNMDVQQVTDFMTFLAPPPRGPVGSNEQAGAALFTSIGCANCHMPQFQTAGNPVAALNAVTFSPYSDFLLHDMGSLGDGIVQNQAGPRDMRTAPLWGIRFQSTLLHDGRAHTPEQAVLAHDGQGRAARDRYSALSSAQKSQLLAFLNSL